MLLVRLAGATASRHTRADDVATARLRRLNVIASIAFIVGGAFFVAGAAVAQLGSGDATTCASIYFVGGLFFSTGGYASLLQVINAPRHIPGGEARLVTRRWRWWSYEPMRLDWLSAYVLFTGTVVFGVNLVDSFLQGLSVRQTNRLVWTPDIVGCILFLLSGHLALVEVCHGRPCFHRRSLGWWIVAVNQLGSVLFMVSALAAYTRHTTGSVINTDIANWSTLAGALCFTLGGLLQLYEHP